MLSGRLNGIGYEFDLTEALSQVTLTIPVGAFVEGKIAA